MNIINRPLIVPIAGGLGGQIFGYTLYKFIKTKFHNRPVYADAVSLFANNEYVLAGRHKGLNKYVWDLGYYGINHVTDASILDGRSHKLSTLQRLFSRHVKEGSLSRSKYSHLAVKSLTSDVFPVSPEHLELIRIRYKDERLLVVHVRQSDYLNVSSKVISVEHVLALSKKLLQFDINRVIFVSDGLLNKQYIESILSMEVDILVGEDYFFTHALMRRANILVTSNSQFSISAAFLSKSQLSIFPKNYFGDRFRRLNQLYHESYDFFVG
jgi:hypothetical protein